MESGGETFQLYDLSKHRDRDHHKRPCQSIVPPQRPMRVSCVEQLLPGVVDIGTCSAWGIMKKRLCLAMQGSSGIQTASRPQEMVGKRVLTVSTVDIWERVIFGCGPSCAF